MISQVLSNLIQLPLAVVLREGHPIRGMKYLIRYKLN